MNRKAFPLFLLFAFTLLSALLSGCVYTRVTEKNLEWGNKNLYADCSKIKGNCVYTDGDGNHYIRASVQEYQEKPELLGISFRTLGVVYPKFDGINYRDSKMEKTGTKGFATVKIPQAAYDYLVSKELPGSCTTPVEFVPCDAIPAKAATTPILRTFPEPFTLEKSGARDKVLNATFLGTKRSAWGTLSLGLLPLSLCCDTVGTVVYTTGSYVLVIPGILCLNSIFSGLGVESPFCSAPAVK